MSFPFLLLYIWPDLYFWPVLTASLSLSQPKSPLAVSFHFNFQPAYILIWVASLSVSWSLSVFSTFILCLSSFYRSGQTDSLFRMWLHVFKQVSSHTFNRCTLGPAVMKHLGPLRSSSFSLKRCRSEGADQVERLSSRSCLRERPPPWCRPH